MKKTIIFVMLSVIFVVITQYGYGLYKTQIENEEMQVFNTAVNSRSVDRLNQFMRDYPSSKWSREAIYYRDKIIINEATESNDLLAITTFLKNYPHSAWYRNGVYYRDKLVYLKAKELNTIASYTSFLENYPGSDWQALAEHGLKLLQKSLAQNMVIKMANNSTARAQGANKILVETQIVKPVNIVTAPLPKLKTSERLNNAVAIYDAIREEKDRKAKLKSQRIEKSKTKKRDCLKLKDTINRYGEHVIWYDLNENGERRYLNPQEVESKKQKVIKKYQRKCVK